ncbi:MAG TPA: BTAD domain-containing putative transcriptional regulator [Chloroflexota bacterium]|nr:BTAD domain-containing putative transcriptional regulator [Chloroflexota bacterium]
MTRLSLSLLGSWQATLNGEPITAFESDKVRALLAYLAVESDRPHRRESLTALFWPERPERNARQNLSQALFNLRQAIADREARPPFLLVLQQTIQFNGAADCWLDVTTFEELIAAARQHRHEEPALFGTCLKRLQRAIAHYRGDFLAGFSLPDSIPFDEWALLKREQLQRLVLEALFTLTEAYEVYGTVDLALSYARRLVELDPWHEEGQQRLLRLLALNGLRNEALTQYEKFRQLLGQEFGIEPAARAQTLAEAIRSGELEKEAASLRIDKPRQNLPGQLTSFIGREPELERIKEKFADQDCRLLTLVGPGGIGKTRLAVQVAASLLDQYLHGVWFVDLSANTEPEQVLASVANTLGINEVASEPRLKTLQRALRQKQIFLLLDNFEHVIEAATDVSELLAAAPGLTLMVTSREVLRLEGEHVYLVLPLGLPEEQRPFPMAALSQYESVRLFLDRVGAVNPAFALTEENATAVAEICLRLEGLPLAIELAAGRSRLFTPEQLLAQLKNRLRTLVGGSRNLSHRQQTIWNTIEWSYQLLDEGERLLFARLGAFAGGWTLEAAESVCASSLPMDVLSGLESLLDKSLIRQSKAGAGGPRFTMLETIREFAVEKLVESEEQPAIHRRHTAYFLEWIHRTPTYWGKLTHHIQAPEVENVRAIMRRGLTSGELAAPVELVCWMVRLWEGRGYAVEMGNWLELVLADESSRVSLPLRLYALALRIAGNLQGLSTLDLQKAYRYYEQSLMISREEQDHRMAAAALSNLANLDARLGNYLLARTRNEEALAFLEKSGPLSKSNVQPVRIVLGNLAEQLAEEGAFEVAWVHAEKALQLAEELEHEGGVAIVLATMGIIAIRQEKYEPARLYLEQALATWDEQQNTYRRTEIWGLLGTLALREHNLADAEQLLLQALYSCAEQQVRDLVPTILDRLAELRFTQGYAIEAVCICAAVDAFYKQHGLVRPPEEMPNYEQILASARQQLGEAAFASAWQEGKSWELFDLADNIVGKQSGRT